MDIESRVNYYTNQIQKKDIKDMDNKYFLKKKQIFHPNCLQIINYNMCLEQINLRGHPNFRGYVITLISILKKFIQKKRNISEQLFLCRWGDSHENIDQFGNIIKAPYFTKTRRINNNTGVLLNFNYLRHWGYIKNVKENDICFHDKLNKIIWRGATTGEGNSEFSFKENRFLCVQKYFDHQYCDIGFSDVVQGVNILNKYIKNKMSLSEQLKYKYILSIEGNDIASGLKWQLYSNSVVFMRKPRIISWAMEDKLIPYVHYIPVKDDFSDLIDQIEFADNNQLLCIKIIKNANEFISQFLDPKKEELILFLVIKKYMDMIRIY